MFKSGFINIIGKPNAGKSTLLNLFTGEKLSAISAKPQTTRKRILGIVNDENYQAIFSDTPGIIDIPQYKLHHWMNEQVKTALTDADIILLLVTPADDPEDVNFALSAIKNISCPVIVAINKIDLMQMAEQYTAQWKAAFSKSEIFHISALQKINIDQLYKRLIELLPEHPPYFDTDELTDKSERFIAAEVVREKIMKNYRQEIPYSVEVNVDEYKDRGELIKIRAIIFVARQTQKSIIIGNKGEAIKKIGIEARKDLESFTGKKIFLELFVKVKENWKDDANKLRELGYD